MAVNQNHPDYPIYSAKHKALWDAYMKLWDEEDAKYPNWSGKDSSADERRSYYGDGMFENFVYIGKNASPSTIAHELFHKLDKNHQISKTLTESLKKDFAALNATSGGNIKAYLLQRYPEAFSRLSKTGVPVMGEAYRGIADILNGLSGGKVYYGYGHREKYWSDPGALEAEAWAQFGRILYENNAEIIKLLNKLFPSFTKDAIIALEGLM